MYDKKPFRGLFARDNHRPESILCMVDLRDHGDADYLKTKEGKIIED